jgi:hypothetical protein
LFSSFYGYKKGTIAFSSVLYFVQFNPIFGGGVNGFDNIATLFELLSFGGNDSFQAKQEKLQY